ncbi:MAG: helix-turn-helix transcriptional regulator [Devosiaceae bacterium]|nr:helix-turn-helix transcriptional regulator [Devosiaceae bacterium MH13]
MEAAFKLFAHYGVGKTSMSEIANAAGVARQTVYNAFDGKEELIHAALLHYSCQTKEAVENECARAVELGERLDILFHHMAAVPYEAMQTLPHLDEILEIEAQLSAERRGEVKAVYRSTIVGALLPYESQFVANGLDLERLAELMKGMFTQIKRDAVDADHLATLFGTIKAIILASASRGIAQT